ncbi:uncharacterized protein LOC115981140 [Quercus lobata]|uniref:uncharacterized protein LOC115981140 n=1 Tax=Quercus lobata TaxID=97700 RepID=UPI001244558A|nr:uncharacterized protein LOC115981140 [Quercus lobata]
MNKPETAGRMVQRAIELSQFDIEYHPKIAIKAQALVDFIAEFTLPEEDNPTIKTEQWTIRTDGIKNQFSSSGHPQANGQTEVTNWTLLKIIKAKLDDTKGTWPEELPNVLWAYKTTTRTLTGETPFRLTYSTEVVIPVEVGVTSIRREVLHEEHNDDQLRINLDYLDEVRDKAFSRMTKYQQKMTEYYNKRVKLRRLDIGDLILRKVTLATRDSAQGKLVPT